MKPGYLNILFILLCSLTGCKDVLLPAYDPQIVVEGWIENDGFPVVILTTTVPVNDEIADSTDLGKYVIRWGKVTISDGENGVVLTGRKDERYFPPYIYTTSKIRGKTGNSYHLTVEYSGRTVTAVTTIPEPVPLEYTKVCKVTDDKSEQYQIIGGLKDNKVTKDYYKVFTKVHNRDSSYVSSFLGLTDDATLSDEIEEIPINRGLNNSDWTKEKYFRPNETVHIKFCTLTRQGYEYWSDFEEIQSLSQNPFFPISTNIRSNIQGGLGYWTGYGSTYYTIDICSEINL